MRELSWGHGAHWAELQRQPLAHGGDSKEARVVPQIKAEHLAVQCSPVGTRARGEAGQRLRDASAFCLAGTLGNWTLTAHRRIFLTECFLFLRLSGGPHSNSTSLGGAGRAEGGTPGRSTGPGAEGMPR